MLDASVIIGRKLLVLTAHPDDESFLAAGTIYANSQAGGQTFLICATLGEKGVSHLDEPLTEEQLQAVRRQELHTTATLLGIERVFELQFPDGQVDQFENELLEKVLAYCSKLQPELIMSFGPDGITGHRDHIAVSKVAQRLAEQSKLPLAAFCLPKQIIAEAYEWLKKRRRAHHHYHDDFTLAEENTRLLINSGIKLQALKCYNSQIDEANPFAGFPDHIAEALLKQECFFIKKPKSTPLTGQ